MDRAKRRRAVASDLPEDFLVEILARVPARPLCRSKCVAKAWRDVIQDPFHRKKLPQTLQGFFSITQFSGPHMHIGYASVLARSAPLHMDPSLSFLTELPGFENLTLLDSCNGLLVFEFEFEHEQESLGYVVCNPTTKQWGPVPLPPSSMYDTGSMYLVFDPAVSSHFHLVKIVWELLEEFDDNNDGSDDKLSASVNVYSSQSGQWTNTESGWYNKYNLEGWHHLSLSCAVLNGMLHFIIYARDRDQIAAVDVQQGVTRKIIPAPITAATMKHCWPDYSCFVAQSQGRLHYINKAADALSIWVLEDYDDDTQEWVSKHSASLELFGRIMSRRQSRGGSKKGYSVVAMHPDANVVFVVQNWNRKLISYHMDHKRVSGVRTLKEYTSTTDVLVPYVPCLLDSPALTNKL